MRIFKWRTEWKRKRILLEQPMNKPEGEEEPTPITAVNYIADYYTLFQKLSWCGVSLSEKESFLLTNSLRNLSAVLQQGQISFFGKIFGTEKDYYIAVVADIEPNPDFNYDADMEHRKEDGVNKDVFYVTNDLTEAWVELPDVKPSQIIASRKIRYQFTGDLKRVLYTNPHFNGQEQHYLRCQLARIYHGTKLVPSLNHYTIEDPENPFKQFVPNEKPKQFKHSDLVSLKNWIHYPPSILKQGRVSHFIEPPEEYFWIKIIDFGTAKIFEKNRAEKAVIGSSYYIAPEVLNQRYNEKCDTWSIGVILYMTLVGSAPFDGKTDEDIINRIKIGKYNKNDSRYIEHSDEVKDLVSKLLEKDISKRLSAKEALNHPWFHKYGGRRLFSNFLPEDIKPYIENLFNYKYNSKLQELVIAFLVHNLANNDETLIILKMFRHFNKKGDCKLTKTELTEALYSYKNKADVDEMADAVFQRLDGDNNGYIEYEEFLRACIDKKTLMTKKKLKYAFRFLDHDNTKTLNVKNIFRNLMKFVHFIKYTWLYLFRFAHVLLGP